MWKIILFLVTLVVAYVSKCLYGFLSDLDAPLKPLDPNPWWGPAKLKGEPQDSKIYPFKINIEDSVLSQLKSALTEELQNPKKWTPPLEDLGCEYGFNTKYLQEIVTYWKDKYDWRAREKLLNSFPNFKTKIYGLDIHFQHVKAKDSSRKAVPILLMHGFPGSFIELQKTIPILQKSNVNFEIIVPSLPGYGFSTPAARRDLGVAQVAQLMDTLMDRLGYDQYYVHGGDWGALIGAVMASLYPNDVKGYHTNLCTSFHPRSTLRLVFSNIFPSLVMAPEEVDRFASIMDYMNFVLRETGYLHIQATKPDTVGVGLLHSPSGLAAYILEKFSTWTNENFLTEKDGGLKKSFKMDEILDNVMVYWVTNSITTSMRLYSEYFNPRQLSYGIERIPIHVPTGCVVAKNDAYLRQSEWVIRDKFQNIVQYSLLKVGGHFLAMEHPQILADDIIKFVSMLESQKK